MSSTEAFLITAVLGANATTPALYLDPEGTTVTAAIGGAVVDSSRQSEPSLAAFRRLAAENPKQLVLWMAVMPPPRLTYAAEALGAVDPETALPALRDLVREHPKSYVREGALYGLERLGTEQARAEIRRAAERDPSVSLREVAHDLLDEG